MNATLYAPSARRHLALSVVLTIGCMFLICSVFVLSALGQSKPAVQFDPSTRVFRMDAADTTYVLGINEREQVQTLYWGKKLSADDRFAAAKSLPGYASFDLPVNTTPQDFVGWGGGLFVEPDLKITFPDGNRDLVLKCVSNKIDQNRLNIVMKDISREVYVTLQYQIDPGTGIMRRSAEIENRTGAPFTIEQVAAGTWNLPRGTDYRLRYFTGRWGSEFTLQEQPIRGGKITLESRRGSTGSQNNPWFAIDRGIAKDQDEGSVWFGALGWSGSWQITVEQDMIQQVRVTGGPNAFDFAYRLKSGERFQTPYFYGGYSSSGIGGASRLLHRFEVDSLLPNAPTPKLRPVLYNSWEATKFDVNEAGQMALAEKAATLGVERFVMDDGWFGQRKDDRAGLGDWYVNPQKFPRGLKPLIDKVQSLGMDFGLWVEPEMINPNSDLYRKHPDWVLNFPGRPQTEGRNQLVLNLARPDVRAYLFSVLDKLLTENDIAFVKWDYNRNWSEPGWSAVPVEEQKNVYVDFTRNFYGILADLRKKHPKVEIESCSGGGSRIDLGVLQYADQVWPSDNTDPLDRLTIQNGFTYAYTPGIMMAWVTDSPTWMNGRNVSLSYRFLSSMQGSIGIGANLNEWKPEDFATAKRLVSQYKLIRDTVQRGALYRLITPENNSKHSVTESVSRDGKQVVTFALLHSSSEGYPFPTVRLKGLDENAMYKVSTIEGRLGRGTPSVASGAYWMNHGVDVDLRGDFQAAAFILDKASSAQ